MKERKHTREKDATRSRSMTNARQPATMVRPVCARTSIEVHVPSTPRNSRLFPVLLLPRHITYNRRKKKEEEKKREREKHAAEGSYAAIVNCVRRDSAMTPVLFRQERAPHRSRGSIFPRYTVGI